MMKASDSYAQAGPVRQSAQVEATRPMALKEDDPSCISAEVPDWSRELPRRFWDPGRKLLRAMRRYQSWRNRGGSVASLLCKWFVLHHRFWSVVTGADIPLG